MRPGSDDAPHGATASVSSSSRHVATPARNPDDDPRSASHRLRALALLSGSLTDALSPEDAASLVEREALVALGATSAIVVTLGAFPSEHVLAAGEPAPSPSLMLIHAIGIAEEVHAALRELPVDALVPFAEVARDGEALFLRSRDELLSYPEWGNAMVRAGANAAAIVPVWANGKLRGVLGLTWGAPRTFDEDERAFVITLGIMCAQAILRSYLKLAEQRAREEAEHANLTKARFLSTISHELRTPINAVMGYTQLLTEEIYGPVSSLQKQHLSRVFASGKHLLELVEELLGYARIEAGEDVVRPTKIMLADVVAESLVLVHPLAVRKGMEIRVEGYSEPLEVFIDARKTRQILVNLLANAVKFTAKGDILLVVRVTGSGDEARLHFEVTDTGLGIAPEDQEHIFDAFWQEDHSRTNSGGGTGLGLSVARQLARLLGGDVLLVRSKVACGSTFLATLPVHYVAPAAKQ